MTVTRILTACVALWGNVHARDPIVNHPEKNIGAEGPTNAKHDSLEQIAKPAGDEKRLAEPTELNYKSVLLQSALLECPCLG